MSTKIKIFPFKDTNSGTITEFLSTVHVTANGFLITDSSIGILYREKNEVGSDQSDLIIAVSAELGKAQKNVVMRALDIRSYTAQKSFWEKKRDMAQELLNGVKSAMDEYSKRWDKELETKLNTLKGTLGTLEVKHKKASKAEKEEILKQIHEINLELNPVQEDFNIKKGLYNDGLKKYQKDEGLYTVDIANALGERKTATTQVEEATVQYDCAKLAVLEATKLITDIEMGNDI